jgi:hypothetical protein
LITNFSYNTNQDYKLSYFCENLSKYEENQIKSENYGTKMFKKIEKWFEKDVFA